MATTNHERVTRAMELLKAGFVGAKPKVMLEIEAEIPSREPDLVVRTVMENGRTPKFTSQAFENE